MKRKLFTIMALFAALTLSACGGNGGSKAAPSTKKPTSSHTHTAADNAEWKINADEHYKDCKDNDGGKVSKGSHTFVADGDANGLVHPEKCSVCGVKAYRLDISEATGWNKSTTKWNAKTTDTSGNTEVEASWDITGKIPAGNYAIQLEALMSYSSHSDRYFYNQWQTDTASQPDKESESPFRYFFKVDDGTAVNPDTTKSWGELGYEGNNDGGSPKFATVVSTVAISATAAKFSAFHGDIGFSLIVSSVRLVELKA